MQNKKKINPVCVWKFHKRHFTCPVARTGDPHRKGTGLPTGNGRGWWERAVVMVVVMVMVIIRWTVPHIFASNKLTAWNISHLSLYINIYQKQRAKTNNKLRQGIWCEMLIWLNQRIITCEQSLIYILYISVLTKQYNVPAH